MSGQNHPFNLENWKDATLEAKLEAILSTLSDAHRDYSSAEITDFNSVLTDALKISAQFGPVNAILLSLSSTKNSPIKIAALQVLAGFSDDQLQTLESAHQHHIKRLFSSFYSSDNYSSLSDKKTQPKQLHTWQREALKHTLSTITDGVYASIKDKEKKQALSTLFQICYATQTESVFGMDFIDHAKYASMPDWQKKEWILRLIKQENFIELNALSKSSFFYQCIFEQHEQLFAKNHTVARRLNDILDGRLKDSLKLVLVGKMYLKTWNELPTIQKTTLLTQIIQEENVAAITKIIPLLDAKSLKYLTFKQKKMLLEIDPANIFPKLPITQQKSIISILIKKERGNLTIDSDSKELKGLIPLLSKELLSTFTVEQNKVLLDMDPDTIFEKLPLDQQRTIVFKLITDSETIPGSKEDLKGLARLFSAELFQSLPIAQIKALLSIEATIVFNNMPVKQQAEIVSTLIIESDQNDIKYFLPLVDESVFEILQTNALIKLRDIYQEKIIDLLPNQAAYDAVLKTFTDQDDQEAFISEVRESVEHEFLEKTKKNIITPAWKVALLEPSYIAGVKSLLSQQQAASASKTSILASIKSAAKMIGYALWSLIPVLNYRLAKNIGDRVDEKIFNNTGIGKWAARICSFIPVINLIGFLGCAAALKLEAKANGVLTDTETKQIAKRKIKMNDQDFEDKSQQLEAYYANQHDTTFIGTFERATQSKEQIRSVFSWIKSKVSKEKDLKVTYVSFESTVPQETGRPITGKQQNSKILPAEQDLIQHVQAKTPEQAPQSALPIVPKSKGKKVNKQVSFGTAEVVHAIGAETTHIGQKP